MPAFLVLKCMKKFLISAMVLVAFLVASEAIAAPKGVVIEDLQITVINEDLKVEQTHRPQGTELLATVSLGKDERCVMSATLKGLPAKGEVVGYTAYKNDDNRFIFGKQNIDGQYYMVIYRVHRGVEILQERTLISRKDAKRPVYLRMTSKNGRVRYYYSFKPLDRWENTGWIRLGIMEGWIAGSKKSGKMVYDFGLYGGKALVQELGPHKVQPLQPMDTAHVCTIPPTRRNGRYYSCQGLGIWGDYAVIIRDKGWCEIYNLKTKTTESYYKLEGNDSHCNNGVFGPSKLNEDSLFPLMYISEDNGGHACFVTDLGWNDSKIVQKIYYDGDKGAYPGPIDWIVDRENGFLYTYGGVRWGMRWLKKFRLPSLADSDENGEVHLTPKDVLFEMTYNEVGIGQGGFIKDGKVYFSAGYPPFHCKLHVFDMNAREEVLCQDLQPLLYEPEGIEIVGDKMYVVFWCSGGVTKIYEFKMPVLK